MYDGFGEILAGKRYSRGKNRGATKKICANNSRKTADKIQKKQITKRVIFERDWSKNL